MVEGIYQSKVNLISNRLNSFIEMSSLEPRVKSFIGLGGKVSSTIGTASVQLKAIKLSLISDLHQGEFILMKWPK